MAIWLWLRLQWLKTLTTSGNSTQHFAIFHKLVYWINLLLIQVLNLSIRKLKILLKTNLLVELTSVVVSNMRKKNSEKMKMEKRRWVN
jgi:hypothetical protein